MSDERDNNDYGTETDIETPLGQEIDGGNDHVADEMEHHGWPGDGSGEDDLADLNAGEADDYREDGAFERDEGADDCHDEPPGCLGDE